MTSDENLVEIVENPDSVDIDNDETISEEIDFGDLDSDVIEEIDSEDDIEIDPDLPTDTGDGFLNNRDKPIVTIPVRPPYHETYYTLYGGEEVPLVLDLRGTMEFLGENGFGNGFMKQARTGVNLADQIQNNAEKRNSTYQCDFCGAEIIGTEFDLLMDGRTRCIPCSRSAITSEEEFLGIYREVKNAMEIFFDAKITVPISLVLEDAKKLHKSIKKAFIPTTRFNPRVLGFARDKGKEGYEIHVESNSPRLMAAMTLIHEMTHIWQFTHWDMKKIRLMYGKRHTLEVLEGMAKWVEIQFAYMKGEIEHAKREEIITINRDDEYGRGFIRYLAAYPLSRGAYPLGRTTPFSDPKKPL